MHKKGMLLSIWWFFVIGVISLGIVSGVLIFYSAEVDLRGTEADILSTQLAKCVFDNGFVREGFLKEDFDFVKGCGISVNTFTSDAFYGKITLFDVNKKIVRQIIFGPTTYEKDCSIGNKVFAPTYPKCSIKKFSVSYLNSFGVQQGYLEIVGGSNNFGRRYSEDATFKIQ